MADAKIDINKFYDVARKDLGSLIKGASINSATIYNDSGSDVTFYVYNYIDIVHWVSAQKAFIANGYYGNVAASGKSFKVHPNGNKDHEYLVDPNRAYVYRGPGKWELVK